MRKAYILKKLTGRVRSFAALMLITLLAVGNAFAEYDGTGLFTKINSVDELTSGYYVVTDATGEFAMLNTGTNYINKTDAVFYAPAANIVWYVDVDADGYVTLYNEAAQVYAALNSNGNSAHLLADLSDKCRWTPTMEENGFVLTNVSFTTRMLRYNPSNPRFACYTSQSTNVRKLAFYKQGPAPAVMAPTFNIPTGTYYTAQTVELNCLTPGANIYYTVNGGEPILYNAPFTVSTTSMVNAYAVLGEDTSFTASIDINFPIVKSNIAALLAEDADNSTVYNLTGDVQFVWRYGKNMFVQDNTSAMLVFDDNNKITTQYNNGDVISGGVFGVLKNQFGMKEMVPAMNTAEGTAGPAIQPIETTIAAITANPDQYMYRLVVIRNGKYQGKTITTGNSAARTIEFYQGNDTIKVYNQFNTVNATFAANEPGAVVGFVGKYNNDFEIFPRNNADLISTAIPYACNLEDSGLEWAFANANTNKWYVGTAQGFDNSKLYISSSNGVTNKYNVSVANVSHAYLPVTLPDNDVLLTFDVRTVGEANDYLQVSVLDAAPVAGTLPTTYLTRIYGVNEFSTQTLLIPAENAGEKYLVFTWRNDGSNGAQQPAAIDNIAMVNTCEMVSNINATVNEHTAQLTWTAPAGQNSWTVQYKDVNSEEWQSVNVSTNTLVLNNLMTNIAYDVRVRSNCGEAASYWATYQFFVPCIDVTMGEADFTIGEGTTTTYYAPFGPYYRNSWIQMIYPASYFETPGYINSLSWEVNAANAQECSFLRIYVGTTTHENNTSTTDWVPMEDLTLVYEATDITIGSQAGWETYTFNTPFYYNGEDNLVIVTSRSASEYKSLYYKATSDHTNSVMYRWNDSDASYASHPGTAAASGRNANLPNMHVDYTGFICNDAPCKDPKNLAVEQHVANSIVTWLGVPGATTYEVQYAETGAEWNSAIVTDATTFVLANLTEGATYDVRVRTVCDENVTSNWVSTSFTKPTYCDAPATIAASDITYNSATLTWDEGFGTSWVVEYGESGFTLGEGIRMNTTNNTLNLTGLNAETEYDVYVRVNCGEYPSNWSSAYSFTTGCMPYTVTIANPWFEDFESYTGSGEKPFHCWETPVKASNGGPFVYCGYAIACHSGENSAELKGYDNVLVLPAFTNDVHTLALSFWATAVTPTDGTLEVGVLTDVNDMSTFEVVGQATNPSTRDGVGNYMGVFSFENVAAANGRIALRYHSNSGTSNSWNLDDFTVFIPQNCNVPVNLAANVNVTDAEAVITWNPFGEETAWQVQYGAAGFTPGAGTVVDVTEPTYTMTGLTEGSTYDVYVRAMCSETQGSAWAGPVTFEMAVACTQYCTYTINLSDQYGDGWNGGVLTVSQNGVELGSYTISSGSTETYTVDLCSGVDAVFAYTAGSWSYENDMTVVDANGTTVWTYNGDGGSTTYTITPSCGGCVSTCTYTINLSDQYGDGWNGGVLTVSQNGEELGSYTISSGSTETYTVDLCSGVDAVFAYTAGSWSYENDMTVVDANGTTVWTYNGDGGSTTYTITPSCGGDVPEPCVSCEYTFELTDSYGDGWTGWSAQGSLDITQGGELVDHLTMSNGSSKIVNVSLCNAEEVTLTLHLDYYETEMGLTVTAPDGTVIWHIEEGSLSGSDDVVFTFTPACVACDAPTALVVDSISSTTASLSWTGVDTMTYNVYYRNMADNNWTVLDVTGTSVTLTLAANTTYIAKVKATCSTNEFTNEVVFFTTSSAIDCDDYTVSAQDGNGYYTPVNDFYKNSHTEQIYTPAEVGASGNITKLSFNYQGSNTMTKKTNVMIYLGHTTKSEFSSTSDWITDGLTLVYTGDLNCSTGWNEFVLDDEFSYNGTDNLVVRVVDESGQYGSSSNKFYYTNCTGYKCMTWQNDSYTWANASSKTGTRRTYRPDIRFNVCSAGTDIALTSIHNIPNGCDLSNIPVTIDMQVTGESSVSAIDAYYRVNDGNAVHASITLDEPLNHGDVYTYTFNTLANLPLDVNYITAWVEIANDGNVANNILTAGPIENIDPATIPFIETFNAGEINDGWFVRDLNNDGVTFNIANDVASYAYNDEMAANDWLMTSCMNLYKGSYWYPHVYEVSYTYKANDAAMVENFGVYFGMKNGDEYVMTNEVATHEFSNTDYVTVRKYISVPQSGTYYFGIHATSEAGNAGFQIDNFSVKEAVSFTVYADWHGSVEPEGDLYAAEGDEVTLTITPDPGYHVDGIFNYTTYEWLRGENTDNAAVEYFTFTPENDDDLIILFTPNKYNVNATVSNLYVTEYNNNAPGAVYTPAHEVVNHGGTHTGVITIAPNYHFKYLTVNGMEVTPVASNNIEGEYFLTLSPVNENKNINVVVEIDSAAVVYTVHAGQGTINGHFVVDGTATYPVVYTEMVEGYTNLWSTITPAPGYHVASIIIDGVEHSNISEYFFDHLFGTHYVDVTFEKDHYYITTHAYGNGTVSNGVDFDYDPDYTYTFTATPAAGYRIASITRNNVALNVTDPVNGYTETLTNILSDYNYEVLFEQNTYSITATCGANGTISPNGVSYYLYQQDAQVVITADLGYYIASVTYDGFNYELPMNDQLTSLTVPFLNISEDHVISATFAPIMYTVTVNAGTHGDITPGTGSFAFGTTPTFNILPDVGYGIADVTVDGVSVGAVNAYTFPALTSDHTIAATFAAYQYTINATAGNGGTITPAGNTTLAYNGTQVYTITANAGYHVSDVYVDGASVGAVTSYTFSNVTENHIIYAVFEANEYTVTVNQPANGTITPGTTTVLFGATPSFVITPNVGYNVSAIKVNGSNVALANVPNVNGTYTYTFPAISANQTLTATMTAKTFTITATAGANGSINPGTQTVNFGDSKTFTFTPNAGYVVANVTVDGSNLGALSSYTFTNVTANHTINVTFAQEECEVPYSLYTTHIDSNSAMLHWSHPTATSFDIQYKTLTGTLTSITNVPGNSYLLTDLNAATTYLWQVRANCSTTNHSDWSNLVSFTTENLSIEIGIEDFVKNSIKVYAEHQNVHILNNEGLNIDNVRIFDTYGRLIYSGSVSSEHEVIGLNVAAGTYIVNVTTDQGVANYKVTILR